MDKEWPENLREELLRRKAEQQARLERITENLRAGLESDSKEQATQLEDRDVVDALGNEARREIARIAATLARMDAGEYGDCQLCGAAIDRARLAAYPHAAECIVCARLDEKQRARR